jgi:phosphatidylserine/phosphatidylglycerophosphate/cardiolipin synthase-like enzyme
MKNLHDLKIPTDSRGQDKFDYSVSLEKVCKVDIVFKNHKKRLLTLIKEYPIIFGCIAWLTDKDLLDAFSKKEAVSIVIQKEDFLRPDLAHNNDWKNYLRRRYERIPHFPTRYAFPGLISRLSYCGDPTIKAIRCVGNYNSEKAPAFPRMHNKFLVFSNIQNDLDKGSEIIHKCVWTGSFNLTKNATQSFENSIIIRDERAASAYFEEFSQIMALSEPLNWNSTWVAPEWRIGS